MGEHQDGKCRDQKGPEAAGDGTDQRRITKEDGDAVGGQVGSSVESVQPNNTTRKGAEEGPA